MPEIQKFLLYYLLVKRFENKQLIIKNLSVLFELSSIPKSSSHSLRSLVDNTNVNLKMLQNQNLPVDQWDTLLIYGISTKLDFIKKRT